MLCQTKVSAFVAQVKLRQAFFVSKLSVEKYNKIVTIIHKVVLAISQAQEERL
jgi:hypothetical protein